MPVIAKYKIDYEFDFTPSRENAQELLLDLATIAGEWAKETAAADHSQCIGLPDHEKAVSEARTPLLTRIHELEAEIRPLRAGRDELFQQRNAITQQYNAAVQKVREQDAEIGRLKKDATAPPSGGAGSHGKAPVIQAIYRGTPHVGELVKLMPRPETGGVWYGGVIKAIHGKGGSKGIEVLPKGHGRTITVTRAQIKRYAVNERADQEALAKEMGVPCV